MIKDFKDNIGREKDLSMMTDASLGYALSVVHGKRYISSVSNIRFGDKNQKYNY